MLDLRSDPIDLTTALDPHFYIAYSFGAVFLAEDYPSGAGRPDQAIERVDEQTRLIRGLGIRVQSSSGQVTLSGTVEETQTVNKAETWVRQQTGVTGVINRLVAAGVFEWD